MGFLFKAVVHAVILLWGYYGNGNFGDDALAECILREVLAFAPDSQLNVTVPSNGSVDWIAPDLRKRVGITTKSISSLVRLPSTVAALVFGGGTWFQDYGSLKYKRHAMLHTLMLSHMRLRRRTIAYVGGSIGPFSSRVSTSLARTCLGLANDVWFRDRTSAGMVSGSRTLQDVAFDPLVLLPEWLPPTQQGGDTRVLGVSAMLFNSMAYGRTEADRSLLGKVATALSVFLEARPEWRVRLFAFQRGRSPANDGEACEAVEAGIPVNRRLGIVKYEGVKQFTAALSECDAVLAFRLHSAITAYAYGIPYVSIEYHPKVRGFNDRVGIAAQYRLDLNFEADELVRALFAVADRPYVLPGISPNAARRETRERLHQTLARIGMRPIGRREQGSAGGRG